MQHALDEAKIRGHSDTNEVVFSSGLEARFTGDLHIARIQYSQDRDLTHFICAVIDQGQSPAGETLLFLAVAIGSWAFAVWRFRTRDLVA